MTTHRIRLRGPWDVLWAGDDPAASHQIRLPALWHDLVGGRNGIVLLTRRFHKPTNMGREESADLVFSHWPGRWSVALNSRLVETIEECVKPAHIAVTALLEPANVLMLETHIEPKALSMANTNFGEVALEIRSNE